MSPEDAAELKSVMERTAQTANAVQEIMRSQRRLQEALREAQERSRLANAEFTVIKARLIRRYGIEEVEAP